MWRKLLPWGVVLLCLAFFGILYLGLYHDPTRIPSPLIGKAVPHFQLQTLNKKQQWITDEAMKGKVTLLNVWATWCVACAEEHSFLMEKANSKAVRLVSLDYKDDAKQARKWLKSYGDPYEWVMMDPTGRVAFEWGVYGTPESFLVDKEGIIRYKHVGPLNASVWQREIEPLLSQLSC